MKSSSPSARPWSHSLSLEPFSSSSAPHDASATAAAAGPRARSAGWPSQARVRSDASRSEPASGARAAPSVLPSVVSITHSGVSPTSSCAVRACARGGARSARCQRAQICCLNAGRPFSVGKRGGDRGGWEVALRSISSLRSDAAARRRPSRLCDPVPARRPPRLGPARRARRIVERRSALRRWQRARPHRGRAGARGVAGRVQDRRADRLVRGEGRDVSDQYGVREETCSVSTRGGLTVEVERVESA
jgi:hypothetical protein